VIKEGEKAHPEPDAEAMAPDATAAFLAAAPRGGAADAPAGAPSSGDGDQAAQLLPEALPRRAPLRLRKPASERRR
jgi:hypothetical protein